MDFTFNGERPVTQDDVRNILFGDELTDMVKKGRLAQPLALLFMWGYYLTMEGCSVDWANTATTEYIKDMKYMVVLGSECSGEKAMSVHGWYRVGTKVAANSLQTQLRKFQTKIWGLTFDTSRKLDKEGVKKEGSKFEIVDIGDFLPERVKKDMTRVSGSRFMVRKIDESMKDMETRLKTKVKELFHWAEDHGIERPEVTKMVTGVVEGGTLDMPVEAPTKRTTDAEPANEDVAAKHNGSETTMAPQPKCQKKKKKKDINKAGKTQNR